MHIRTLYGKLYMKKFFILKWYGPFQPEEVQDWESSQKTTFNLYLIGGKKKYSKKKIHYYIGKAERRLLSDRLNDKNHHINDFSYVNEIWIGTVINKKATHKDILLLENMLTSYFDAEGELLNVINKKLPEESIYLINEWIHYKHNSECLRLSKTSIGNLMPDVIVYKKDESSNEYKLFISNKLKATK